MAIELLSFDLDDTLWPCLPTIMHAEQELFRWMQKHVPRIAAGHDIDSLRQQRADFLDEHPQFKTDLTMARKASLRALSEQHAIEDDWVETAFSVFHAARQQVTLYDDVAAIMDRLQQRYRLVAVSNGNADINRTGVGHWFEFCVNAEQVGFAKPHPKVFETVLHQAGVTAGNTVHIGDDPEHDILGAHQLGLATVWVNRRSQPWPQPDYTADRQIRDFTELPAVLTSLDSE